MTGLATQRVEFDGELTIISASGQYQRLRPLLAANTDLRLDTSRVTEFDTAGLQLLLAVQVEARRLGSVATIVDPSEPVREVLSVVQLTETASPATSVSPAPPVPSLPSQEIEDANR